MLFGAQISDVGSYSALISNSAGSVTSAAAALRVNTPFRLEVKALPSSSALAIEIGGRVGSKYVLQSSGNLLDWGSEGVFLNTNGVIHLSDPEFSTGPARFFRAIRVEE